MSFSNLHAMFNCVYRDLADMVYHQLQTLSLCGNMDSAEVTALKILQEQVKVNLT